MMNRIDATFAALKADKKTALIPFITAGDPALDLRTRTPPPRRGCPGRTVAVPPRSRPDRRQRNRDGLKSR